MARSPEEDKEVRRLRMAKYRANNKEKCLALSAEWRKNNPDKVKRAKAKYRKNNLEVCRAKDRRRANVYTRKLKIAALNLHGSTACEVCGEDCIHCLAFHHRNPGTKGVYRDIIRLPRDKLVVELDKCDVLCHNCHAKIHYYMLEGDNA